MHINNFLKKIVRVELIETLIFFLVSLCIFILQIRHPDKFAELLMVLVFFAQFVIMVNQTRIIRRQDERNKPALKIFSHYDPSLFFDKQDETFKLRLNLTIYNTSLTSNLVREAILKMPGLKYYPPPHHFEYSEEYLLKPYQIKKIPYFDIPITSDRKQSLTYTTNALEKYSAAIEITVVDIHGKEYQLDKSSVKNWGFGRGEINTFLQAK